MTRQQEFIVKERPTDVALYVAGEAARECECSASTIRRLAEELKLAVLRTQKGCRIFTADQVQQIASELERRRREAWR